MTTLSVSSFEFSPETFRYREASETVRALSAALDAMIQHGADDEHTGLLALMLAAARKREHAALKEIEREEHSSQLGEVISDMVNSLSPDESD